ncbi:mitochondrial aaa [Colletotrichum karsti]|uniref:Mitochondrial aaa n=1 Tax=Colletotrichum karsti TaxID=1095194 RepID=A0A9P6LJI8_9PEZI|nr:mitochondrial aaa [Colletotrichum karsti]KAF9875266.1 mitochondrial aaa [Colletotrichum karsti]
MADVKNDDVVGFPKEGDDKIRSHSLSSSPQYNADPQAPSSSEGDQFHQVIDFPQWLLDHCVITSNQWGKLYDPLVLRYPPYNDTERESDDDEDMEYIHMPTPTYQVAAVVFEPLMGLFRRDPDTEIDGIAHSGVKFNQSIVRLQSYMSAAVESTATFLREVVKQLAMVSGSDLITLTQDDLEDLADIYALPEQGGCSICSDSSGASGDNDFRGNYLDVLLRRGPPSPTLPPPPPPPLPMKGNGGHHSPVVAVDIVSPADEPPAGEPSADEDSASDRSELEEEDTQSVASHEEIIPLSVLLRAPYAKKATITRIQPLIVHLFIGRNFLQPSLLADLRRAISDFPYPDKILLIVTTESGPCNPTYEPGVPRPSREQLPTAFARFMEVTPIRCTRQEALIKKDGKLELLSRNIRALQRMMRRDNSLDLDSHLLVPHDKWHFYGASNGLFAKTSVRYDLLRGLLQNIGQPLSEDRIRRAVLGYAEYLDNIRSWKDFHTKDTPLKSASLPTHAPVQAQPPAGNANGGSNLTSRPTPPSAPRLQLDPRTDVDYLIEKPLAKEWRKFSPAVQKVIRQVLRREQRLSGPWYIHGRERQWLSFLVAPKDAELGWSDIAMDSKVEDAVKSIVSRHNAAAASSSSYGVLQRYHVGGVLLYGPPGTGKSHLAQVLARESGSNVILIRFGDGDPTDVSGLFNLGRLLAPCIIFIDNAELLLASDDKNHEFEYRETLAEIDRACKSKDGPLIILSTNSPGAVHPGLLRRAPNRIHMGLPSSQVRTEHFRIMLRGEILHSDISHLHLSHFTWRFSGEDIRTLCLQAVIACNTTVADGDNKGKRLLTQALFREALKKVRPSTSSAILAEIRKFATEHDPAALEGMETLGAEQRTETEDSFVDVQVPV